jgi:hypothetical protein
MDPNPALGPDEGFKDQLRKLFPAELFFSPKLLYISSEEDSLRVNS